MKTEFGDYDEMYGGIDYTGARVLDIGADYGSTAMFFLDRMAAHVFASERNEAYREQLVEWATTWADVVTVLPAVTAENIEEIFVDINPDVVKVDCEGCERFLLELSAAAMHRPRAWVVETHSDKVHAELMERFRLLRYRVEIVMDYGPMRTNPDKVVRVVKAVRDA